LSPHTDVDMATFPSGKNFPSRSLILGLETVAEPLLKWKLIARDVENL